LWSRASKTVSHEGADLELDVLTNRMPVKRVSNERRDMEELCDTLYEKGSRLEGYSGRIMKDGEKLDY